MGIQDDSNMDNATDNSDVCDIGHPELVGPEWE